MDRQRKLFDDERGLWHLERLELHDKVSQLETSLRKLKAMSPSEAISPVTTSVAIDDAWNFAVAEGSKHISTGNEFWRGSGGKNDAQPTRIFPDLPDQSFKHDDRLPSIAEDSSAMNSKPSFSMSVMRPVPKADKDLDGITFKPSGRVPSIAESLLSPQSPLSPQTPSPTAEPSENLLNPLAIQTAAFDPYTKDAGQTPLARGSDLHLSTISSGLATPVQPETERPPFEPHASFVKVPSERAESYFPPVANHDEDGGDGDMVLTEPLSLKNSNQEDKGFLQELDKKLVQAANSTYKTQPPESNGSDKENMLEDKGFDQPEPEPRLRIKRSMNFGSRFGAAECGKGF